MTAAIFALLAVALAGCNVFDPALYMEAEADAGGMPDASSPDPGLSDQCVGEVPMRDSTADLFVVDTRELTDDIRSTGACTGENAPGTEGFFGVEMTAGEKWHFHVRSVQSGRNPSIYVLGSACDIRTCQAGEAIDACGTGSDEHLSFVAPTDGVFRVGIDDRIEGGAQYQVLALSPECGNGGMPEHSETCDDGNTAAGDGCDSACRAELSVGSVSEVEPNDDVTGANVVLLDSGSLTVRGSVGGSCDFDTYAIEVPEGADLRASMLNRSGEACGADTPPIAMVMYGEDGLLPLGDGANPDTSGCPAIDDRHGFASGLSAGTYHVRVHTDEDERPFDYRLQLAVIEP